MISRKNNKTFTSSRYFLKLFKITITGKSIYFSFKKEIYLI